ncbi:hypothetical protein [Streptomyces alkaliterrae]|uniref:Uncharacterized protein n=1 Tax=Streptomyces alkaliterrae TaxID=2213162 RepID=A0A5P0YLY5_9ACTN|nr:hypothetical protein [Streptomyces alkaliterrae]MBB1260407.1 hypothetical protein [Streptomyces alkaliterrae]MQS01325.1 hypothetical protein [Streptomyces alkaliterrae]
MRNQPHDTYISAVSDALTEAGLTPADWWTEDTETRGTYCYLNAVITLDPSNTHDLDHDEIPTDAAWPHGLLLLWEWHTGIEAELGEPERGPIWQFAEVKADGSTEYPTPLPVYGYASPAAVVKVARMVIDRSITPVSAFHASLSNSIGELIGDSWNRADELAAACAQWSAREAI